MQICMCACVHMCTHMCVRMSVCVFNHWCSLSILIKSNASWPWDLIKVCLGWCSYPPLASPCWRLYIILFSWFPRCFTMTDTYYLLQRQKCIWLIILSVSICPLHALLCRRSGKEDDGSLEPQQVGVCIQMILRSQSSGGKFPNNFKY